MASSPTPAPVSRSPTPTRRRERKRGRWHSARTRPRQEVEQGGEANARTGPTRPPRGQESHHAGRRVRPRGDPPRARGQARRALGQAGHRHRPVQGAPGWRQAAAAEEGDYVGANAPQRHLGVPRRSARQAQDLRAPRAGAPNPPTFGAPRQSRVAPLNPGARGPPAKPWRASTPPPPPGLAAPTGPRYPPRLVPPPAPPSP